MPELIRSVIEPLENRCLLASVPSGFTDTNVASGLASPTAMTVAPDGRLFIAQQGGGIRIVKNNSLLSTPFATLPNVNSQEERGLLGIVLDPDFENNHYVYVYYTSTEGGLHNRIARLTANGDVAASNSLTTLVDLPSLGSAIWHMGGPMEFGPDGKLYVGVGDHQYFDQGKLQTLEIPFGKILRFNSDGSIPTDNPFYNDASGINRATFAMGLRNPFNFGFQPGTGRMFINDVGQEAWEEINEGEAGANYGWPVSEGPTSNPSFVTPIHAYQQIAPKCAIVGSLFYNPDAQQFPNSYVDKYFFADLCEGVMRYIDPDNPGSATVFATGLSAPVDFDLAPDGSIYYLQRTGNVNGGQVGRISFPAGVVEEPEITSQPEDQNAFAGQSVTFNVGAAGQAITYQWLYNGGDIDGETGSSLTINNVVTEDAGDYRVRVSNVAGDVLSDTVTLAVTENTRPVPKIVTPIVGTTFEAGQTITLDGRGTDAEDGKLGPSKLTWQVDYYTGGVVRPFVAPTTGQRQLTVHLPTTSVYTQSDVFYRIRLTARDSNGATTTKLRDIKPITAQVTVRANIAGATVFVDEQPKNSPTTFSGVAGLKRDIGADEQVEVNGDTYVFDSWSDGGEINHEISTPDVKTTFTARYRLLEVGSTDHNLTPTADAFVFGGQRNTNFGSDSSLLVKTDDNETVRRDAYIKFDLSDIDGPVASAKFRFYAQLSSPGDQNLKIGLHHAAGAKWSENNITWRNRPSYSSKTIATAVVNDNLGQWYELDIASFINAELARGRAIFTFVLHNAATSKVGTIVGSSESANGPELKIVV